MTCSQQDARFKIICEELLDVALDATVSAGSLVKGDTYGLFDSRVEVMEAYFVDSTMLRNNTNRIGRIASHISTQCDPWMVLALLADIIETIMKLIAASPDPEFSCTEIRAENVVSAFVDLISHLDALDCRLQPDYSRNFPRLETASHSFLLLIAIPFTGPSVLCNSHCISVLEENGWVGNAVSANN
ncbi:hypothetical protein BU17DRAFT_91594 [Hysterangium stoloniferum]|nr:hypothetical protein BU17DRAFT_91594 [Hysterangium stoloniferum]